MAREMKDSGVEWIGEIPREWEIRKIKYVAQLNPKIDTEYLEETSEVTFTPMEKIKNGYFINNKNFWGNNNSSYTNYSENDIVMAKVTPCFENGNIAIMKNLYNGIGFGSSELFVFRSKKNIRKEYLFYFLRNEMFKKLGKMSMTGAGGLKRVSSEFILNFKITIPPLEEQEKIANYLDKKISNIDLIIEKTKVTIEDYKKYKQSIITETVTQGLNSNVEMKDSGIEWIGKIPKHWKISPIKYILKWKSEKNYSNEMVLSLYRDYGIVPKDSRDDNHNVTSEDTASYKFVEVGDFVINKMKAWQGSMAVSDYQGIVSPAYHVCSFKTNELNKKYFHYLLRNQLYLPEFRRLSTGLRIGQWDLGFEDFKQLPYLFPPLEEQNQIVEYIDKKISEIDALITKKEALIKELEEYKKSLIYECVTGKKEVTTNV